MRLLIKPHRNKILLIILIGSCNLSQAQTTRELPIPDEVNSAMTIQRSFVGILAEDDHLFLFPEKQQFMVKMPFNPSAKTREEKFGKLTDHLRIPIEGAKYPGDWRGGFRNEKKFIAWDASILQLLVLRLDDFKSIESMTIPSDTIKPAADAQGEPTTNEIQKTQSEFRKATKKVFGTRYTGITEIPAVWEKNGGRKFLITSKIPGFPLILMSCDKNDDATCLVKRRCFLEKGPKSSPGDITGVGVFESSREVLIGNRTLNRIEVYQYRSCFDVVWKRTLELPKRLSKLTNLHIDKGGRLWVSTQYPDSYSDANLYYWDRDAWK